MAQVRGRSVDTANSNNANTNSTNTAKIRAMKPKIPSKIPPHWTGDTSVSTRQQVPDNVKMAVQAMMDGTWKDIITRDRYTCGTGEAEIQKYEVVQVLRNQNPKTWATYAKKRDQIRTEMKAWAYDPIWKHKVFKPKTCNMKFQRKFSTGDKRGEPLYGGENEMLLFHGTKPDAADAICEDHFRLGSPDALFGAGCYFAECSSKSDEYVKDEDESIYQGLFATLLCRVIMGRVLYDANRFPDKHSLVAQVQRGDYHSVIGDREKVRGTYREFIVYDNLQAYPEYVVIYRRVAAKGTATTTAEPAVGKGKGKGKGKAKG